MSDFIKELETLINKHSVENGSNTPDFILAEFLQNTLNAMEVATKNRDKYYRFNEQPVDRPVFKREDRYMVLKWSDIERALNLDEVNDLYKIREKIAKCRHCNGKMARLKCVVVEHDWPEYEPTWQAIEQRVLNSK